MKMIKVFASCAGRGVLTCDFNFTFHVENFSKLSIEDLGEIAARKALKICGRKRVFIKKIVLR